MCLEDSVIKKEKLMLTDKNPDRTGSQRSLMNFKFGVESFFLAQQWATEKMERG